MTIVETINSKSTVLKKTPELTEVKRGFGDMYASGKGKGSLNPDGSNFPPSHDTASRKMSKLDKPFGTVKQRGSQIPMNNHQGRFQDRLSDSLGWQEMAVEDLMLCIFGNTEKYMFGG